ncbi:MAG: hypothetical protein ACWGQW_12210 [bacterium]
MSPDPRLYKRDPVPAMGRLVSFWKRQARDQILITTLAPNPHWENYLATHGHPADYSIAAPGYTLTYFPLGVEGADAECLCMEAPSRVMEMIDVQQRLCADLEDDSMPIGYPNLHFGESVFAGFAGSPIQYSGNGLYTWSGTTSPPLSNWANLEEVLARPLQEPWRSGFINMAESAVQRANGHFGLRTFISIDTLNLAVEWRGGTNAYLDLADSPDNLLKICDRGVELNKEVLELERKCYDSYNRQILDNRDFCSLAPALEKPLLSVDAFTLVSPQTYRDVGMSYQQRLLDLFGGGHMHMHGTNLYQLLPLVAELKGLISIELGDDGVRPGDPVPIKDLAHIQDEITQDIPLYLHCTCDQFVEALERKKLRGGVHYCVRGIESIKEANSLVTRSRDYVPRK